jgi:hypothetical protein
MSTENKSDAKAPDDPVSRQEFNRWRRDVWLFLVGAVMVSLIPDSFANGLPGAITRVLLLLGLFIWAGRGFK